MMLLGYRTMVSPRDFGSLDLGSIPSALVNTVRHNSIASYLFIDRI